MNRKETHVKTKQIHVEQIHVKVNSNPSRMTSLDLVLISLLLTWNRYGYLGYFENNK